MNKKNIRFIMLAGLIVWIGLIFYFSSQPPVASNNQSGMVVKGMEKLDDLFDITHTKVYKGAVYLVRDQLFQGRYKSKNAIMRKSAHFGIYFILGSICSLFAYLYTKRLLMAFLLGLSMPVVVAVLDEFNQSFVGRSGSLNDVLLDGSGALLGTLVVVICILFVKMINFMIHKKSGKE